MGVRRGGSTTFREVLVVQLLVFVQPLANRQVRGELGRGHLLVHERVVAERADHDPGEVVTGLAHGGMDRLEVLRVRTAEGIDDHSGRVVELIVVENFPESLPARVTERAAVLFYDWDRLD